MKFPSKSSTVYRLNTTVLTQITQQSSLQDTSREIQRKPLVVIIRVWVKLITLSG